MKLSAQELRQRAHSCVEAWQTALANEPTEVMLARRVMELEDEVCELRDKILTLQSPGRQAYLDSLRTMQDPAKVTHIYRPRT